MSETSPIRFIEIPAPDLDAAVAFYGSVFGWSFERLDGAQYVFWSAGALRGAFDPSLKPSLDGVNIVLEVDDIDAKLQEIEAAGGGTLKPRTFISPDFGHYATFRDPNGNRLSLWQPPPPEAASQVPSEAPPGDVPAT